MQILKNRVFICLREEKILKILKSPFDISRTAVSIAMNLVNIFLILRWMRGLLGRKYGGQSGVLQKNNIEEHF
jgi:hypothetical protein